MTTRRTQRRANGEGSISQRPDGRWTGQAYVTQSDGKRVRRTVYGRTRKEVERKVSDLVANEDRGRRLAPLSLTVEAYLREWLDQVVSTRVRPNTLAAYRYQAERYLIPDLGARRLAHLSARELRLYFASLERRGVGARTVKYVHSTPGPRSRMPFARSWSTRTSPSSSERQALRGPSRARSASMKSGPCSRRPEKTDCTRCWW